MSAGERKLTEAKFQRQMPTCIRSCLSVVRGSDQRIVEYVGCLDEV